jgi:SAM-dependent methyltransferase
VGDGDPLPYPPRRLTRRVGAPETGQDAFAAYEQVGGYSRERILDLLPGDWSFAGKRVLDFGCGSGRTLRHFRDEARAAEITGCDIDAASIAWVRDRLCPPFSAFVCGQRPPLPAPDASFDLVWALSVFTHLADSWSDWLLELDRVLAPGGMVLATVIGPEHARAIAREPWDENRIGMNVLHHWKSWDLGGPTVLHSEWWLRAHWGRLFDIAAVSSVPADRGNHRWLVLRKRDGTPPTSERLEELEPGEPREAAALRHNVRQLQAELDTVVPVSAWRLARPIGAARRALRRVRALLPRRG